MTQPSIGIDTSVLVRLVTGQPPDTYAHCMERLNGLAREGIRVVASNQAIGESYVAVQLAYGFSRAGARAGLAEVLTSGLVEPQNGQPVLDILAAIGGAGTVDRLIAEGYAQTGLDTLTLDRRMSRLPRSRLL